MVARAARVPILVGALGLAALMPRPAVASAELRVDGSFFRDASGGAVILRGVNVAGNAKVPPFRALRSAAELDPLPGWGLNVIRLLFTWEAYEPERGSYDETYIEDVAASAEAAWARGVYVVIDFHQDAFSRYAIGGCGDGFPKWALPTDVQPATPDNGPACADWGVRMLGDMPMMAAWSAFHRGDNGVRERFLAMVERVAGRLSRIPGVVAYDVMNEPWGDEGTELAALHRGAAQAIRAADPTAIMFLSPHALVSSGFFDTQLPKPSFANAVYSPHYYDASVLLSNAWSGSPPDDPFRRMRGTAAAWGVPLFVGEFGGPATADRIGEYMDAMYDRLNETFASGTQWVYTPAWTAAAKDGWNAEDLSTVDDTGALRANFRVRPSAGRIAGTPTSTRVTHEVLPSDNVFELVWEHVPSAGNTDVFLPLDTFFGTSQVTVVTEGEGLACAFAGRHLVCASPVAGTKKVLVRSDGSADGGADGAVDAADDGAVIPDAEVSDSGPSPPEERASAGCGCALGRRSSNHDGWLTWLALGMAVARVTRRSASKRHRTRRDGAEGDG